MLDDINRVLAAIEALIFEFSERYNLPSHTYNLSNYLLPYLISVENRLQFGSYPRMEFKTEISSIRLFMICKANRLNQIREETFL